MAGHPILYCLLACAALAPWSAADARADSSGGMLCRVSGSDDLLPGELPVDQYRRIARRRDHWRGREAIYDTRYAVMLANRPPARDWKWESDLRAIEDAREEFRINAIRCQATLDDLGARSVVELWSDYSGVVKRQSVTLGQLDRPGCAGVAFSAPLVAFEGDRVYEIWAKDSGAETTDGRARYYSARNPEIGACVQRVGEGASVKVRYESSHACEERFGPDSDMGGAVGYRLRVTGGVIELDHRISLIYRGDGDKRAAFRRVESVKECIERFYAGYGFRLKLTFHTNPALHEFFKDSDVLVHLKDEGRNFQDEWNVSNRSDLFTCGHFAHEIGHQLGLDDLYPEQDRCPDRVVGSDTDNLMYHGDSSVWSARLDRSQVRSILAPLCDPEN